jgi:hypothetical protein
MYASILKTLLVFVFAAGLAFNFTACSSGAPSRSADDTSNNNSGQDNVIIPDDGNNNPDNIGQDNLNNEDITQDGVNEDGDENNDGLLDDGTPQLSIISVDPANGTTGVVLNKVIAISFSEELVAQSVSGKVGLNVSGGAAAMVAMNVNGSQVMLTPLAALTEQTEYVVWVETGVRGTAGGVLPARWESRFTTCQGCGGGTNPGPQDFFLSPFGGKSTNGNYELYTIGGRWVSGESHKDNYSLTSEGAFLVKPSGN